MGSIHITILSMFWKTTHSDGTHKHKQMGHITTSAHTHGLLIYFDGTPPAFWG